MQRILNTSAAVQLLLLVYLYAQNKQSETKRNLRDEKLKIIKEKKNSRIVCRNVR